ncbi:retrotransposon protein, putative, ty3-gypsy subclass [Tanacetum coccineum]
MNEVSSSYAHKLSPTSSTKANLRKHDADVPNDADYDIWLPLASVHEPSLRSLLSYPTPHHLNDLNKATLHIDGQSTEVDAPPDIIDLDEDDDIIDDEDALPHDLADSDVEDLVNVKDDDGVEVMSADVARGHGGDGGGDDRPPSHHIPTGCGGCFANRGKGTRKANLGGRKAGRLHTRQETRNLGLKKITDDKGPVPIRFEWDDKKTMMPLGGHASHWSNYLGELIREMPLYYPSWQKVPAERKAAIVTKIGTQFDLTPHMQSQRWADINAGIQQHLQKLYNTNKASLKAAHWVINPETGTYDVETIRQGRPESITPADWDAQIAFWNDPRNQARAAQNRQNRAKSTVVCRQGSRSLARLRDEMMASSETREYPSLIDTFFVTHTVNGVFIRDEDRAIYEEMVRLRALGSNTESGVPYTDEEINAMARKGKQRGHLPGVGRVLPGRARDLAIVLQKAKQIQDFRPTSGIRASRGTLTSYQKISIRKLLATNKPKQQQQQVIPTTTTISNIKLPILKKEDNSEMEISRRNLQLEKWCCRILPPVSAAEIHAVEKERKARTILLMAIPKEHLRRFHGMDDAKEIWEAIRTIFEQELTSTSKSSASAQNVAFVSHSKSSTNKVKLVILVPTVLVLLLLQTIFKKEKFPAGLADEGEHTVEEEEKNHARMAISSNNEERELGEGYSFIKKKCFVCGSLSHLIKDCDFYEKKMAREAELKKQRVFNTGNGVALTSTGNNANRVNRANHFVPRPVQLNAVRSNVNTGRTNVNSVRHNVNSVRTNVNTGRSKQPVPTNHTNSFGPVRPQVNKFNQRSHFSKSHSPVRRPIVRNTARMTYSHAVKGNWGTAIKTSAGYNWRRTRPNSNYNSGSNFVRTDHPLKNMEDRGIFDSGCSGHMTGNKDHLDDFEECKGGSVTFGGSKGYITEVTNSEGTLQTHNANASKEEDEAEELIIVPTAVR